MDNQSAVDIHVLQGERPMATDNRGLGNFQLRDIPPAQRGIPQIEVTFDIDANGIISVGATDKGTGKEQKIRIDSGNSLSESEIEKMKIDAEQNAKEDEEKMKKITTLNEADSTIFQTERQLKEFEEKLGDDDKEVLTTSLNKLKESHKNEDLNAITSDMEELNTKWQSISSKLYEQTQTDSPPPTGEDTETTDVEYEEVN